MGLENGVYRVKYTHPDSLYVYDFGEYLEDNSAYQEWLQKSIELKWTLNFFLVGETTDVFEKEVDFNTTVFYAYGQRYHTYNPECPRGCSGELKGCVYNKVEGNTND